MQAKCRSGVSCRGRSWRPPDARPNHAARRAPRAWPPDATLLDRQCHRSPLRRSRRSGHIISVLERNASAPGNAPATVTHNAETKPVQAPRCPLAGGKGNRARSRAQGYGREAPAVPAATPRSGRTSTVAVRPVTRRTPGGTWSRAIRTGTRCASRTQLKVGLTLARRSLPSCVRDRRCRRQRSPHAHR